MRKQLKVPKSFHKRVLSHFKQSAHLAVILAYLQVQQQPQCQHNG
jgi:hypothetical protein